MLSRTLRRSASSASPCPFCSLERVGPLLHEDPLVVAFADARPRARRHLLVVSRAHIRDVAELRAGHAPHAALLRHMMGVGEALLGGGGGGGGGGSSSADGGGGEAGVGVAAGAADSGGGQGAWVRSHGGATAAAATTAAAAAAAAAIAAPPPPIFGFHMPPWSSVPHLHMHCLGPPFTPAWERLRFLSGLGTFTEAAQLLRRLETAQQ